MSEQTAFQLLKLRADVTACAVALAFEVSRQSGRDVDDVLGEINTRSAAALAASLEAVEDISPELAAQMDKRPLVTD